MQATRGLLKVERLREAHGLWMVYASVREREGEQR
jgi:hypothetical protein